MFDVFNLEEIDFECEELVEKFAQLEDLKKNDEVVARLNGKYEELKVLLQLDEEVSELDDSYQEEKDIQP